MALPAAGDLFKATFDEPLKKLIQPAGLIPALVLVGLDLVILFPRLVTADVGWAVGFGGLDAAWQLGLTAITIVLVGYVILALSPSVLQVATGEAWPTAFLRPGLLGLQTATRNRLRNRHAEPGAETRARDYELRKRFPTLDPLAPTALGNAVSAIGDGIYSSYGADLTATWTQMREAIRKESEDFLKEIDEDEVGFLSLLNVSAILVVFVIQVLLAGLAFGDGSVLAPAVLALAAAWTTYRGAVGRIQSWGDRVAAAYDLFRPKLRELLGIGKPITAAFERSQFIAVSSALAWDRSDRSFADDELPVVRTVPTSGLVANLLQKAVAGPVISAAPNTTKSRWIFEYLIDIRGADDEATTASGVVEVTDRGLPVRIPRDPTGPGGTFPSATPRLVVRHDIGLRDTIQWTIGALPNGETLALGYRLVWELSLTATGGLIPASMRFATGIEDVRGWSRLTAEMRLDRAGSLLLELRDDRLVGDEPLVARLDLRGRRPIPLVVTRRGDAWLLQGDVLDGVGLLKVRIGDG